ncbi:MAG: 16S rRNA (guanine(966)-N(2))-methyltransferase RsmD [Alphaproteobacteria bacterium]|nr:16S rRNA (guanine(966)-N(2))-methyltransferase RsmD [Alphaproteobacteria bacterium]
MRIIAGRFRGRPIASPQGNNIRPTADRLRETIFNILTSRLADGFAGLEVLDLFAGTGAMGIEALSRGAARCLFVDHSIEARALLRQNMENFGLGGQSRLLRRNATDLGPVGKFGRAGLVFVDPPYGEGLGEQALGSALAGGWIAPGATIVFEEAKGASPALPPHARLDRRDHGATSVWIFQVENPGAQE